MDKLEHKLRFFLTAPHSCNYLDNHEAISLFADPVFPKSKGLYTALVENGFRRSGEHLYKPYCENCSECVPVRIPVNEFKPNRNQKRVLKKNSDVVAMKFKADFKDEHFQLYKKYLSTRHANGGMDNPEKENYQDFLWSNWSDTLFFEYRLNNKLVSIAVIDQLKDAYSAVYTFFDPDYSTLSPGKFTILHLINEAKQNGLNWLYLGYWIAGCNKMKYKVEYQPIECFIRDEWRNFDTI